MEGLEWLANLGYYLDRSSRNNYKIICLIVISVKKVALKI